MILRFRHRNEVEKLLRLIFNLDAYLSIAKVANERKFVFAKALPAGHSMMLQLEGVFHPQLKKAVPNNIHVSADSNIIFLTGANMAGKSTFMKSLSIAMFLAHVGFPVAAKKWNSLYSTAFTQLSTCQITWVWAPAISMQKYCG